LLPLDQRGSLDERLQTSLPVPLTLTRLRSELRGIGFRAEDDSNPTDAIPIPRSSPKAKSLDFCSSRSQVFDCTTGGGGLVCEGWRHTQTNDLDDPAGPRETLQITIMKRRSRIADNREVVARVARRPKGAQWPPPSKGVSPTDPRNQGQLMSENWTTPAFQEQLNTSKSRSSSPRAIHAGRGSLKTRSSRAKRKVTFEAVASTPISQDRGEAN